jgi:hypothetical protein
MKGGQNFSQLSDYQLYEGLESMGLIRDTKHSAHILQRWQTSSFTGSQIYINSLLPTRFDAYISCCSTIVWYA